MTPAARLSAAIEVLADIDARRRPAADALKDWGLAHRFAGSGDRAAIAGLAYDALRRRASAAWIMGEATPRAILLGMLRLERGLDLDGIAASCSGARFAPAPLSEAKPRRAAARALRRHRSRKLNGAVSQRQALRTHRRGSRAIIPSGSILTSPPCSAGSRGGDPARPTPA